MKHRLETEHVATRLPGVITFLDDQIMAYVLSPPIVQFRPEWSISARLVGGQSMHIGDWRDENEAQRVYSELCAALGPPEREPNTPDTPAPCASCWHAFGDHYWNGTGCSASVRADGGTGMLTPCPCRGYEGEF